MNTDGEETTPEQICYFTAYVLKIKTAFYFTIILIKNSLKKFIR